MKKAGFLSLFFILVFVLMNCAGSAKKVSFDPESESFYETARLIMTGEEKDIFNHLPDRESRQEFIEEFWSKRDPDPTTEENEFKEEFFERIDYANKHFREGRQGWNTDRGRIYIYLGPPEKTEEFLFHDDPEIRGSLIWWIYYTYDLGIEFVDEKGLGAYTINRIEGNLLDAMERAKLGQIRLGEGGQKKFLNFKAEYNRQKEEIVIAIPVKFLSFKEEEGVLKAEFDFEFYIYGERGTKKEYAKESRTFKVKEEELLQMKEIFFTFLWKLREGRNYIDIIVIGKDGIGKARKIFEIKI